MIYTTKDKSGEDTCVIDISGVVLAHAVGKDVHLILRGRETVFVLRTPSEAEAKRTVAVMRDGMLRGEP